MQAATRERRRPGRGGLLAGQRVRALTRNADATGRGARRPSVPPGRRLQDATDATGIRLLTAGEGATGDTRTEPANLSAEQLSDDGLATRSESAIRRWRETSAPLRSVVGVCSFLGRYPADWQRGSRLLLAATRRKRRRPNATAEVSRRYHPGRFSRSGARWRWCPPWFWSARRSLPPWAGQSGRSCGGEPRPGPAASPAARRRRRCRPPACGIATGCPRRSRAGCARTRRGTCASRLLALADLPAVDDQVVIISHAVNPAGTEGVAGESHADAPYLAPGSYGRDRRAFSSVSDQIARAQSRAAGRHSASAEPGQVHTGPDLRAGMTRLENGG